MALIDKLDKRIVIRQNESELANTDFKLLAKRSR